MSERGGGYSGTPLPKKLGLKPGMTVRLVDPPEGYWSLLGGSPDDLGVGVVGDEADTRAEFTHLFASDPGALVKAFDRARAGMTEDGMVWASWPKKSSDMTSEIGRAQVMAAGQDVGLVDVKVCAVDETWSALKFVVPVEDRNG